MSPGLTLAERMLEMLSAAFTGTVLFSTTILEFCATLAIRRAADSMYFKSGARPYWVTRSDRISIGRKCIWGKGEWNILNTCIVLFISSSKENKLQRILWKKHLFVQFWRNKSTKQTHTWDKKKNQFIFEIIWSNWKKIL